MVALNVAAPSFGADSDSELIIGQDFSVGYQSHTNTEVNFFITESFTFRTLAPEAIVPFKLV